MTKKKPRRSSAEVIGEKVDQEDCCVLKRKSIEAWGWAFTEAPGTSAITGIVGVVIVVEVHVVLQGLTADFLGVVLAGVFFDAEVPEVVFVGF